MKKISMVLSIEVIVILCLSTFFLPLSQASVNISIGNGSGAPGSSENPVEVGLDNPDEVVRGVQMDICDVDDFLSCTECETTSRTSDFMCTINELPDGCSRVVLFSTNPGGLIDTGTGPILSLKYNTSEAAPAGECRGLNPENLMVSDENNSSLNVISVPGEFCFDSVTLTVGNGSGAPGSSENPVEVILDNPDEGVKGVQMDICDVDDFLSCTECETTSRTADFMCTINELPDGCSRVVLFSTNPGGLIDTGTGPILSLKYNASESAPAGECRGLNPENLIVSDENNSSLHVISVPGEFCFDHEPKISEPYLLLPPDFPALSTDINSATTIQDHAYIFWTYSDYDPSVSVHWAAAHKVDWPLWAGWYSFDTYTYNLFGYDIYFAMARIDPDNMTPGTYVLFYSVTDSTGQEAKSWETYPDTSFYFIIE